MRLTDLAPNGKLIMSTVKGSMLNEEVRRKKHDLIVTHIQSEALVTELIGRSKTKFFS